MPTFVAVLSLSAAAAAWGAEMRYGTRPHPQAGWLHLARPDYQRSLDRLIAERDRLADPNHSGAAPAYVAWAWCEELPALAGQPFYSRQIEKRVEDLNGDLARLEAEIKAGRHDLQPQAQQLRAEIGKVAGLLQPQEVAG